MGYKAIMFWTMVFFVFFIFVFYCMRVFHTRGFNLAVESASPDVEIVTAGDWTIIEFDHFSRGNFQIPQILKEFEKNNPQSSIKKVDLVYDTASSLVRGVFIWHTKRECAVE